MITELKPTNLIAVEVAPDASNYRFGEHLKSTLYWHDRNSGRNIYFPEGSYKILGEVTKDKIGFDVEPYVETFGVTRFRWFGYKNYLLTNSAYQDFTCKTKEELFYSLLEANGLYFENPEGESYPDRFAESDGTLQTLDWHRNKWKEFEDKLIRGKLLILEKTLNNEPDSYLQSMSE